MNSLVSIIIPCFNAAKWVCDAVESCLLQTYEPIEVIVVDDGSTDESVAALKRFDRRIHILEQSHGGGNRARNLGFFRSRGEIVQFLDADDYLLPHKIEKQVACLEHHDVVYGDWRHQYHEANGSVRLGPVSVSGRQEDVFCSLLDGWWVAPAAVLIRRTAVIKIGGWDESLRAAQDTDLMIRLAAAGLSFTYLGECDAIYRRYGNITVGTSNPRRWLDCRRRVLEKAQRSLESNSLGAQRYKQALARSLFRLSRAYFELDRKVYRELLARVFVLDPQFKPDQGRAYNLAQNLFGFGGAEWLALILRRVFKGRAGL